MADEADDKQPNGSEESEENGTQEDDITFVDGQLSYIGHDAAEIPEKLITDYASITRRLDLSFNQLQSLNGLDQFVNLEELILDNNCFDENLKFPKMESLHTLTVNKNKITNLSNIVQNLASNLPGLRYLSMLGNVACPNQLSDHEKDEEDYRRYRFYVLFHLNNLKFLDSSPVKLEELAEAKRVGPFMQIIKGTAETLIEGGKEEEDPTGYTPLPESQRKVDDHKGSYGRSKYVYYGRHSEGNRFIRNNDL
ncbi:leucine-rich melanocyte differentiation-associated protein-like [Ylistrum balloti]|uniref:leucine-rich melanocyte differentiation-associated protein-like n=1 Tax=Ylistrum balloti TaxID=509963 RepID=UPI002905ACCF|nr:leucine-rich melanocyte differentiation-associated protein-like [Ylistrum balloti]